MRLARDCSVADITAVLHSLEAYRLAEGISGLLSLAYRSAQADGAQHPPAVRDDVAVDELRAGVKDLSREACRVLETANDVAFAHGLGIAGRGEHDAERGACIPACFHRIQLAVERGVAQYREIRYETRQDGLRLGIAEAAIELEHVRRAVFRDHDSGV